MELPGSQVIVFLNRAGRQTLRPVLRIPRERNAGVPGLVVGADANGVWLSQAEQAETLTAVLVKWQFMDSVVAIIQLERPRERVGF